MITKSKLNVLLLLILLNHKNSISVLSPCPTFPRFLNSCNIRKLALQPQEAAVNSWALVVWLTQGPPLTPALLSTNGKKKQSPHSCSKPQHATASQAWFPGKAEFTSKIQKLSNNVLPKKERCDHEELYNIFTNKSAVIHLVPFLAWPPHSVTNKVNVTLVGLARHPAQSP